MNFSALRSSLALFALVPLVLSTQTSSPVRAQEPCDCDSFVGTNDFGYRIHHHSAPAGVASRAAGQAALSAVQEVVALLLADPTTDWSRVSITRLRQHLRDLDLLMTDAEVEERSVEEGLDVTVRGTVAVREAAGRVLPEHLQRVDGFRGWSMAGAATPSGDFEISLRTEDAEELSVLRGMGFFGVLASGVYRPHQLLAIAQDRAQGQ